MYNDFLEELTFLYYISYDFPQLQYNAEDFDKVEIRKKEWATLSVEEKLTYKEKTEAWIEEYKKTYPNKIEIVVDNWKKINW